MLRHYFLATLRAMRKNKLIAAITVVGLSLATGVFLSLASYVSYHTSFDRFYDDNDRIYRLDYFEYNEGAAVLQSARTHDRAALVVHDYVPEIEAVTRIYNEKAYVWTEDVKIVDQDMLFVDSSFFRVFNLKLLSGSPETALVPPLAVVISKSQSKVYFGDQDPIGKTLFFNERLPFVVTGVFEDIPVNSSIDFDFLLSWSTIYYYGWATRDGEFTTPSTFTFVKLKPNADIASIDKRLEKMATENIISLKHRSHTGKYALRPYRSLHETNSLSGEIKPGVSWTLLMALLSLGVFILVAAWVNYVNLSLARSIDRADEIGVRKVFGATRSAIGFQFLIEAVMISVVTFLLGYGLFALLTGPMRDFVFNNQQMLPGSITNLGWYFVAFVIITTLVSFYPAHFISKFKPALILKNKLGNGRGNAGLLQQSLMVLQLFIAVIILSVTVITISQISYIRNFDSGFDSRQTVALRAPASTNSDSLRYQRYLSFRNEVLTHPTFTAGTSSFNIPGQEIRFHDETIYAVGAANTRKQSFWVMWIDEGYQDTFGMKLLGGRNFNLKESPDACIINERAARDLGYANPVDAVNTRIINDEGKTMTIVGVWKDYHHESIHKPVNPIVFYHRHPFEYGYYSFQVNAADKDFLQSMQKIWDKHYPNDQFVYYFMDNFFAQQYASEEMFGRLLKFFSIIAVTVAALGLFGMATLSLVKRAKEIGIRKVLGASVPGILMLLSKRYMRIIAIGCAFAFPLTYYLMTKWLNNFAYRIEISWWMIALPGVAVLFVTLALVGVQSARAAMVNPVDTLKDE